MEQMDMMEMDEPRTCGQTKVFWQRFLIIGGVLVAAAVIAIVIVFTTTDRGGSQSDVKPPLPTLVTNGFDLSEALDPAYIPVPFTGAWGTDTKLLFRNEENRLVAFHKGNKSISRVIPDRYIDWDKVDSFVVSPDSKYILLAENKLPDWVGHGHHAYYTAMSLDTHKQFVISTTDTVESIQYAEWSTKDNAMVFVQNDTLYYKPSVRSNAIKIIEAENMYQNVGFCDFIYESEIFLDGKATWFSPDGSTLAFAVFDDTFVTNLQLPIYGKPGSMLTQYPQERVLFYPKPGHANPIVDLMYVSTNSLRENIDPYIWTAAKPNELMDSPYILTGISWASNTSMAVMWTNRAQSLGFVQVCSYGKCVTGKEIVPRNGWIEPQPDMVFSSIDASNVAMIEYREQFDRNYASMEHISITNLNSGNGFFVTNGPLHVANIAYWSGLEDLIFFHGNYEQDSQQTHLFVVRALPNATEHCLTCGVEVNGVPQTVFRAEFDKRSKLFVLHIMGPSIPSVDLYEWSINFELDGRVEITKVLTLVSNKLIHLRAANLSQPIIQYLDVPISVMGMSARVKLMIPPGVSLKGESKYPMMVLAYNGPNSYTGTDDWSIGWGTFLSTNRSVVCAIIDARSMGRRSDIYHYAAHGQLGTVEVKDTIDVVEKLGALLPYVDKNRVGIWGWSFGGYVALMALAKDKHVFSCAASVAGVTDWKLYNSMYTERYMGLPQDPLSGLDYRRSNLLNYTQLLRGKQFYLIHGTLDENVHYQQMMMLTRQLELEDIDFEQMSYPDETHSIAGTQWHVYSGLNRFFSKCFGMEL